MKFIADFHIHSHFSIATSKNLIPRYLDYWAVIKGIDVIGTGDAVHPGWLKELEEELELQENGLYSLKDEYRLEETKELLHKENFRKPYFILSSEISNIYKKDGRVRKVHNLCVFPHFEAVKKLQNKLRRVGSIESDGRPILGLDSKILLQYHLETSDNSFLIPAHIWTPWFSVLGSKSGFDSIEECYEDLSGNIFALETGLSSDPPMNRVCSFLDRYKLVSNSDAHSPEKIGREANIFNSGLSYKDILNSLKGDSGFIGTIEFHPQEGKYFYDGHRKCNIRWDPLETISRKGICTVCGKAVTKGVMHRVARLADRGDIDSAPDKRDFYSITQLPDVISEIFRVKSSKSKRVVKEYFGIIENLGPEFYVMLDAGIDEIEAAGSELLAEAVRRLRNNEVIVEEGYDGEFGKIRVFSEEEIDLYGGSLFGSRYNRAGTGISEGKNFSVRFDIEKFKDIYASYNGNEFTEEHKEADKENRAGIILSQEQKRAVRFDKGNCVIIAGPGSGKTRVLTERISYLIEKKNVNPSDILAITFSNHAAEEISHRIKLRAGEAGVNVTTYHSFGLSMIGKYFSELGRDKDFTIIGDDERMHIIENITDDKRKKGKILREIRLYKQRVFTGDIRPELIDIYNRELIKNNSFDLDDLVLLPLELLENKGPISKEYRGRYQWIFVDEFQDINRVQYDLLRAITANDSELFLIGDPDQSIYSFRGSKNEFFQMVLHDYPGTTVINLNKSYRCPQIVLKAGSCILDREDLLNGNEGTMRIHIHQMETDRSEADWIAERIEKMLGGVRSFSIDSGVSDGNWENSSKGFSDFAVLCRSAFMFQPFIEAFKNHGIAYQVIDTKHFCEKEPFSSVLKLFRSVLKMNDPGNAGGRERSLYEMIQSRVNVSDIIKKIMEWQEVEERELEKITSFAGRFENNYNDFLRAVALRRGVDDFDTNAEAVSLMTLHASKGLQFNTVFIPGCEQGIIPFSLFGSPDNDALAEEKRLLYVGITRTEESLYLTHAEKRNYRGRILRNPRSAFLNSIERDLYEIDKREKIERNDDFDQLSLPFPRD